MKFPTEINVTGQKVDISDLTKAQKEYLVRFKDRLIEVYGEVGKDRVVISLSGISGTTKTSTAEIIKALFASEDKDFEFYIAGLDAFHFTNDYLEEKQLKKVKGRFDTYDIASLKRTLAEFKRGEATIFPKYSREIHNPVEGGFCTTDGGALLLIEGLWFLRDDQAWEDVREHIDYNFLIEADESVTKAATVARHVKGGRSQKEAEDFYEASDHQNTLEILKNSVKADEVIPYYKDIVE